MALAGWGVIRGVAAEDTVQDFVVSGVRVVIKVLRGSCTVVKTRQHYRDHRRQRQEELRRAGCLVMNHILTCIKQGVMVAWVNALGALHPWDWGGRCWRAQAGQTFATCNGTEAALPLAMVLTLTRGLFGSTSASDTFLEHWITFNLSSQVPGGSDKGTPPGMSRPLNRLMQCTSHGTSLEVWLSLWLVSPRATSPPDGKLRKQNLRRQPGGNNSSDFHLLRLAP